MPNLADIDNPTEDQEQEAFVQWLRLKGYPHFRVPNETYTKSWNQKAKNKKLGVSSGVPDLAVVVPDVWHVYGDNVPTNTYTGRLVFIEMKRKKGGVTSEKVD
mgnify:FL=1|jgi:hypothetical protein